MKITKYSKYIIENSNFTSNHARELDPQATSYFDRNSDASQSLGRGGGMYLTLRGQTNNNTFVILNCKFLNNTASTWGGGMYLILRDNATSNSIEIKDCEFKNNKCTTNGGGGLILSLINYHETKMISQTLIEVTDSKFIANTAKIGGGILLSSSRENYSNNKVNFMGCNWVCNRAELGSAVDISPSAWDIFGNGHLPTATFTNCIFESNHIEKTVEVIGKGIHKITERVGTMLISRFSVRLAGEVSFIDNNSSGIFLQSGSLTIEKNSQVSFVNNTAKKGGALIMYAFSAIFISSNTSLLFQNNTATIIGGAVYVSSKDQHETISSKSCFLQRSYEENGELKNATITFKGNVAKSQHGNSLYASSLLPCILSCFQGLSEDQKCPVTVQGLLPEDIATSPKDFQLANDGMDLTKLVPGKTFRFPIEATDELNNTINVVYAASLNETSSIIFSENVTSLSYVSNQNIYLEHKTNDLEKSTVLLANEEITLALDVTILECPPGHIKDEESNQCTCKTSNFKGIWKCDAITKTASIINGYWIGLCGDGKQCSANCPVGLCKSDTSISLTKRMNETSQLLCNSNREGKLCAKCTANHSVYYHSDSYKCGKESYCKYGILFYILSEIFPLTIIFIVIITFNISFTAGAVNGIILYAQIYDASIIDYYNIEVFPKAINTLFKISKFIYATLNLNYFHTERLSFCLWRGATTLDVIAWKYITIVYALFLIIVTVYILNTMTCKRICIWWRPNTLKNAVIHGFTAFLVMSYSQCAKVSFQLLTYTTLVRHNFTVSENVVLYNGEENVFSKVHARYGVPAIVFMLTIVILPPLLLLLYPLSFKILALCRLSELKIVNRISNIIPVQLFDSFQSCYKDNLRFFSGLYFLYRVVPLFLYAINTDLVLFYFTVEIFLILALALHSLLQPYKLQLHNQIDCLIFMNLALINGISLYNYVTINEGKEKLNRVNQSIRIAASFQLILIYLPLLYIIIFCIWYIMKKWKKRREVEGWSTHTEYDREILLDSTYLPPLRDRNESVSSHEFHEMK